MRALKWGVGLLLIVGLGGCVGLVRGRLEWVAVTTDLTTKSEVLERFGEPRRKTQEADAEVWYYLLADRGPSGRRPAQEAYSVAWVLVVPVWWRTRPDENARLLFKGDTLSAAAELAAMDASGFVCGLNLLLIHGRAALCGRP